MSGGQGHRLSPPTVAALQIQLIFGWHCESYENWILSYLYLSQSARLANKRETLFVIIIMKHLCSEGVAIISIGTLSTSQVSKLGDIKLQAKITISRLCIVGQELSLNGFLVVF